MAGHLRPLLLLCSSLAAHAYLQAPLGIGSSRLSLRSARINHAIRPRVGARGVLQLQAASASDGLVLGPPETPERFDNTVFSMPVVRRFETEDDGEFWRMWYAGRDDRFDSDVMSLPSGRIGLCESRNGIHWKRHDGPQELGSILSQNKDEWWWFDTAHCGLGDVQILSTSKIKGQEDEGSVYFMYYMGGDKEEVDVGGMVMPTGAVPEGEKIKGLRMRIGMCLSFDGEHWTRYEGDHHSGAVFDVGGPGDFDELYCGWPQVLLFEPKKYVMYYHTYDRNTQRFTVGVAVSPDGFDWQKKGPVLSGGNNKYDMHGVGCRHVLPDPKGDGYLMFGEGVGEDSKHYIMQYKSKDGFKWSLARDEPVLESGPEDSWDAGTIGCPWPVPMPDGSLRLYYAQPKAGIGMAESDGEDWSTFRKVPQLKVTG